MKEAIMAERHYSDGAFLEPFFLGVAVLWVAGALFFISMSAMGSSRVGGVSPGANQTPVAADNQTQ
jgi:hypothetical protein